MTGTSSVDSIWVGPNAAVEGAKTGKFKLVFATERNLIKLGKQNSAAASLDAAKREGVVTVCPEVIRGEKAASCVFRPRPATTAACSRWAEADRPFDCHAPQA